jgi:hypothetical protein
MRKFIYGALSVISMFAMSLVLPLSAKAASTVVVTPQNMNGWMFVDDTNNTTETATGHMVQGPSGAPAGIGSAELETTSSADGQALMKNAYGGQKFTNLSTLTYSTYVKTGNSTVAPAVQFSVDKDVTDNDTSWQGRIVFEPYLNGTVTDATWQNWNVQSGVWWLTRADKFDNHCPQASPCALSDLTSAFPNIGVNNGVNQQILFKVGSGWTSNFVGNVDDLTVAFTGGTQTNYDFEPFQTPENTGQCKNNGYKNMRDDNGLSFKNQGQCVSWVEHNVNGNGQGNNSTTGGGTQTGNF